MSNSPPSDEITQELAPLPERPPGPPWRQTPREEVLVSLGAATSLGRARDVNEDKYAFFLPDDEVTVASRGSLFAVADGMGGHAAGQIASEIALDALIETYYGRTDSPPAEALLAATQRANRAVYSASRARPSLAGMGTTLTAAAFVEGQLVYAHVGDSRGYLLRDGALTQFTTDHSWVAEQVQGGLMSEDEARRSPNRNVITRCIGLEAQVAVDVDSFPVANGDVALLCSDGLVAHVSDAEIRDALGHYGPSAAARLLVYLANEGGGTDNTTVLVVRVQQVRREGLLSRVLGSARTES
jgi:serine/threonine protein phosphatase PrpC